MDGKCTCFSCWGKWEKFGDVLAERNVTLSWLINSNMVKPEKFDHLHLVYHFTVPLTKCEIFSQIQKKQPSQRPVVAPFRDKYAPTSKKCFYWA